MKNNDFNDLVVDGVPYSIAHLKDHKISIDVLFDNGDTREITVHMRPTNHLFSRQLTAADEQSRGVLIANGHWLTSYVHHDGNYQQVKGQPPTVKEHRIFCLSKFQDSFYFTDFVSLLRTNPRNITVLANAGDDRTCLSGILNIAGMADTAYLVFFTLSKINSKEANMLIESAFCVDSTGNSKAQKLVNTKIGNDAKPFVMVLKNVMEGRKPMDGAKKGKKNRKNKK